MMTTSNEELRRLADALEGKEWEVFFDSVRIKSDDFSTDILNVICQPPLQSKHANFIAATNPAKVKAMLDQIDALTKDKKTLADALEKIVAKCEGGKP